MLTKEIYDMIPKQNIISIIQEVEPTATTFDISEEAFIAWDINNTPVFLYSGGIGAIHYFEEIVNIYKRENNLRIILGE